VGLGGGLSPGWEVINVGNYDSVNKADFLILDTNTSDLLIAIQDGVTITTTNPVVNLGSDWTFNRGKP